MNVLAWMATASRRTLRLAKPGGATVTITPHRTRGWTVETNQGSHTMDAVQLEDAMDAWSLRGYREVTA